MHDSNISSTTTVESFDDSPQDILVNNYIGDTDTILDEEGAPEDVESGVGLSKSESRLSRVKTQLSFFNPKWKSGRLEMALDFAKIYLIMGVLALGIFSIYWGSMYDRFSRLKNLEMLVVVDQDTAVGPNQITIGGSILEFLNTPRAQYYGHWNIYNHTEYAAIAAKNNLIIEEQVKRDIHHQKYWSAIYVHKNATGDLFAAMQQGNSSYSSVNNTVSNIYETGRDFINMNTYVTSNIIKLEQFWLQDFLQSLMAELVDALSESEKTALFSDVRNLELMTTPLGFQYVDMRPYKDAVLIAPSQVGLIYMIIITFVGVGFFNGVHQKVYAQGLRFHHYVTYRIVSSFVAYFWLSLMYSFVTLAMQVDFSLAFGRAGFIVYWMTLLITMWVVGSVNEIMAMWFILYYPPLIGFWLLFWVIINISPTFTPLAIMPKVYRYGYALPLHNSYDISKVIFFNTYKGLLGRNYGILAAWSVLTVILFVITSYFFEKTMVQRKKAAAQKAPQPSK